MRVSQAAITAGMKAGRKALDDYSSFDSAMVPDAALQTFVTDVLVAGFGTVPSNTIMGPGAHPHPNVNPVHPPVTLMSPGPHDTDEQLPDPEKLEAHDEGEEAHDEGEHKDGEAVENEGTEHHD